jgi:hypothetical protein
LLATARKAVSTTKNASIDVDLPADKPASQLAILNGAQRRWLARRAAARVLS